MQTVNNAIVTGTLRVVGAIRTETAYITTINITNTNSIIASASKAFILNPDADPSNYDYGVRLNSRAATGYSAVVGIYIGGTKNSTSGTMDGMWTVLRQSNGNLSISNNASTEATGFVLYRDNSAPSWRGTRLSLANHTHSYLPLAGGTMTGNINYNMYGRSDIPFKVYGGDANGLSISVGAGGATIVGSGESAKALESVLASTSEELYLASDTVIRFFTKCDTIGNKLQVVLDTNRYFYPGTDNTGSVGTSSYRWASMYATTFVGTLSGNASTATKLQTARTITLSGSVTGSVTFDGSANVTITTTTNHTHSYLPLGGGTLTGNLTVQSSNPILTIKNTAGNDTALVFDRATNANWRMLNAGGTLYFQSDYTTAKTTYYNVVSLFYNSGNMTVKGTVTAPTFSGSLSGNAATATKLATARTITLSGSVTGSATFDGTANITITTSTNHTHSYLPLTGGTLTGLLTANKGISIPTVGGGWNSGMTQTQLLTFTGNSTSSYHPMIKYVTNSGNVVNIGALGTYMGFFGYKAGRTENGYDCLAVLDTSTNRFRATAFEGPLTGNASSATILQTARTINGTSFNGSANITTANWGTARTITIGASAQSVNGSTNYSFTHAAMDVPTRTGSGASGTWGIAITGNAATATRLATARSIFGKNFDGTANIAGQGTFYGPYVPAANRYNNSALQIREVDLVTSNQSDIGYGPSIGFHWGNRIGATLVMGSDGQLNYFKIDGVTYGDIHAGTFTGSLAGNASTASSAAKLSTARTITLAGSVTGSATFDGSANITITTATNHSHSYLPLSGGTMTGNIAFNMYNQTNYPMKVFGGNADGQAVSFGAGAATIVGAGESARNMESVVTATTEQLHLASDGIINFYTTCQTIANRNLTTLDRGIFTMNDPSPARGSWATPAYGCITVVLPNDGSQTSAVVGKRGSTRLCGIDFLDSNGTTRIYGSSGGYLEVGGAITTNKQLSVGGAINGSSLSISGSGTISGNTTSTDFYYKNTTYNVLYSNKTCDRLYFMDTSSPYLEFNNSKKGKAYGINCWQSDARLKENIEASAVSALDIVNKIRHFSFTWKEFGSVNTNGYIAQELEKVNEDFVLKIAQREQLYNEDGTPAKELGPIVDYSYQVNETTIIPYLSKAIQEEDDKVNSLTARVQELEEETQLLRKQVDQLRQQSVNM